MVLLNSRTLYHWSLFNPLYLDCCGRDEQGEAVSYSANYYHQCTRFPYKLIIATFLPGYANHERTGIYLQELVEDWEEWPCSPQQQGQHGFSRVHVQTPLVLILMSGQKQQQ